MILKLANLTKEQSDVLILLAKIITNHPHFNIGRTIYEAMTYSYGVSYGNKIDLELRNISDEVLAHLLLDVSDQLKNVGSEFSSLSKAPEKNKHNPQYKIGDKVIYSDVDCIILDVLKEKYFIDFIEKRSFFNKESYTLITKNGFKIYEVPPEFLTKDFNNKD